MLAPATISYTNQILTSNMDPTLYLTLPLNLTLKPNWNIIPNPNPTFDEIQSGAIVAGAVISKPTKEIPFRKNK